MRVELLIYIYGVICISMILFNCARILVFNGRNFREDRKTGFFEAGIQEELNRLSKGVAVDGEHIRFLEKKLKRTENLMAFHDALTRIQETKEELLSRYLSEISPVFLSLAVAYSKKEIMESAYFAWFLSSHKLYQHMYPVSLFDMLKEYLKKDGLYCRQNVMKAFYSFGDEMLVLEGIKILDGNNRFFHGKILTDGLLTFEGNHRKLCALLWRHLDGFSIPMQTAILNYIRFQTGEYCEEMLGLLMDETKDRELHYAAIRYFARYYYPEALPKLLCMADDRERLNWNYAALSATALALYPGEETLNVLKRALTSSNWYVRYNAAASISRLGVSYYDLLDVMGGNDRYAREMMNYHFAGRTLDRKEEEGMPV